MIIFWAILVDFLYSLGLKFVASSVRVTCVKKNHVRKIVKLYIKTFEFIVFYWRVDTYIYI
jgi:hypothetical protein